ncbi:MAG: phosphodiesterase [Alphaproteobacteria bacterium]|nr:phosphodiesterase [Alphaproteobacteria bacterium]
MLIAHITDLHLRTEGELAFMDKIDTAERLERTVAFLNDFRPRPDMVLATGDLVDFGKAEEYRNLRRVLDRLEIPVYLIPGNHDHRDNLRAVYGDHAYLPKSGFLHYVVEGHPVRLIGLDTLDPGKVTGLMCPERLAWLDARLSEDKDTPTLVFMHHPPYSVGIVQMDNYGCVGGEAMGEIVRKHPQVERVVCGHLHRATTRRWNGTVVSTNPATAPEILLNINHGGIWGWAETPPFVGFYLWQDGGIVSHLTQVDPRAPAQPFPPKKN